MPQHKDLKRLVRARMGVAGLNYTQALTALIRGQEVTHWAGTWLRVDTAGHDQAIDNMRDRPLRGATDWTPAANVLDVGEDAASVHFGAV